MTIQLIALGKLVISPLNTRRSVDKTSITSLKADILSHGLMQNLVVSEGKKGVYNVIAGGRRLTALDELQNEGKLPKDYKAPCQVVKDERSLEMSLAENVSRVAMHPADEFEAFAELIKKGEKPEQIALRFGVKEKHVQQRLRLARVAPEILKAYRKGDLNLDCLMAFTINDDHNEQRKVYKGLGSWGKSPNNIKHSLVDKMARIEGKLCKFVTLDAYKAAGGTIREDLFGEESYIEDAQLLTQLANEKLEQMAQDLKAKGWGWVETALESNYQYVSKFGQISEKTKEDKKNAGCFVSIDYSGKADIETGLVKKEDKKTAAKMAGAEKAITKPEKGITQGLLMSLKTDRLQVAQLAMAKNPELAIDLLIYKAACEIHVSDDIDFHYSQAGYDIIFREYKAFDNSRKTDENQVQDGIKNIEKLLPNKWFTDNIDDEVKRFAEFRKLHITQKEQILAYCLSKTLIPSLALRPIDEDEDEDNKLTAYDAALALSGIDVADYWRPTAENYLNSITRDQLVALTEEIFGKGTADSWRKAKKGDLVTMLDAAFKSPDARPGNDDPKILEKLKSWLPEGMSFAIAMKQVPEKKPRKAKKGQED